MSEYVHGDALVDADWATAHIDDPKVRLIEVDEDTTAYERGHIPNAVGWNWFSDMHAPVRRDYVDQAGLTSLVQRAGVDDDMTVVLYGGNNNWFAAYAYWLCRYRGFDAVKLLNGGRTRWERCSEAEPGHRTQASTGLRTRLSQERIGIEILSSDPSWG